MNAEAKSRAIKHIPNVLSATRIPLSLSLLLAKPFSPPFVFIYLACGLTDALDGFCARRFHAESEFGAQLDSVADFTFFAVALYVFLAALSIPPLILIWAFSCVFVRACGLAMATAKFRSWAALHTNAFRVMGFVFFCFPAICAVLGTAMAGCFICTLATLATGEELYINLHSSSFDPDIRSVRQLDQAQTSH